MTHLNKVLIAAVGIALPMAASAQTLRTAPSPDVNYCMAMSDLYVRYVGHDENSPERLVRRGDAEGEVAVAKCRAGDAATAIPVLERKLTDARITLPARG